MLTSLLLAAILALAPAGPESVTLEADRAVVTYGDPVRLSVLVEPPEERRSARLERRTTRGWQPVERLRLGSRSAVRFSASLPAGLSRVRVVVEPSPGYARGVSRVAVIRR